LVLKIMWCVNYFDSAVKTIYLMLERKSRGIYSNKRFVENGGLV